MRVCELVSDIRRRTCQRCVLGGRVAWHCVALLLTHKPHKTSDWCESEVSSGVGEVIRGISYIARNLVSEEPMDHT